MWIFRFSFRGISPNLEISFGVCRWLNQRTERYTIGTTERHVKVILYSIKQFINLKNLEISNSNSRLCVLEKLL